MPALPRLRANDLRLLPVTFGNFATACSAMIVVGMLNEISADLGVSIATAGLLAAATAVSTAIAAPLLGFLASRRDRRTVLSIALGIVAAAQFLASLAPGFWALLAVRLLTGLGPALYPPTAATAASLMSPPEERGRAVTMVFVGYSAATVLGIPLGVWLGAQFGWRTTMFLIGCLAVISLLWVRMSVPKGLHGQPLAPGAWRAPLADRRIVALLVSQILQAIAQMMSWSYIAPLLKESIGATPGTISLLLAWFGLWAVGGQTMAMRWIDRVGAATIGSVALICMLVPLALWPLGQGSLAVTTILMSIWALGAFSMTSTQQVRLIAINAPLAPITVGLNSAAFAAGNMSGTVVGGAIVATAGLSALTGWSALAMCVALGLHLWSLRLTR